MSSSERAVGTVPLQRPQRGDTLDRGSMRDAAVAMRRTLLYAGLLAAQVGLSHPNPGEECAGMGVRKHTQTCSLSFADLYD